MRNVSQLEIESVSGGLWAAGALVVISFLAVGYAVVHD
jgi:hypothetical protein